MGNSPSSTDDTSDEGGRIERCASGSCTKVQQVSDSRQHTRNFNNFQYTSAAVSGLQMWKNGVIPYEIDHTLDFNKSRILRAMKTIEKYSRMRFEERWNQRNYLMISQEEGCAFIEDGVGHRRVSLGIGCEDFGTVLHELLHAIGFPHEQKRPDRDRYITIRWGNIERGQDSQFWKLQPHEFQWSEFPFDFNSIMLYEEYAFSRNGRKTIEAKDGRSINRKQNLSKLDKEKLAML